MPSASMEASCTRCSPSRNIQWQRCMCCWSVWLRAKGGTTGRACQRRGGTRGRGTGGAGDGATGRAAQTAAHSQAGRREGAARQAALEALRGLRGGFPTPAAQGPKPAPPAPGARERGRRGGRGAAGRGGAAGGLPGGLGGLCRRQWGLFGPRLSEATVGGGSPGPGRKRGPGEGPRLSTRSGRLPGRGAAGVGVRAGHHPAGISHTQRCRWALAGEGRGGARGAGGRGEGGGDEGGKGERGRGGGRVWV